MAVVEILIHPDPILRKRSKEIKVIDKEFKKFLVDLTDTMYEKDGVGLAAPQIGVLKRVVVIDVSEHQNGSPREPQYFINPVILEKKDYEVNEEGCLSIPDIHEDIKRASYVKVRYFDENLDQYELEAEGLLAIALQHEIDHLNGKLFIDYLSPLKYNRITKKMKKYKSNKWEFKLSIFLNIIPTS